MRGIRFRREGPVLSADQVPPNSVMWAGSDLDDTILQPCSDTQLLLSAQCQPRSHLLGDPAGQVDVSPLNESYRKMPKFRCI